VATQQELLDQLDAGLAGTVASGYTTSDAANDLFEGYVWSIVIAAARDQGAQIQYQNVFGQSVNALVLRTSPGNIYSTNRPYTHAVLDFQRCRGLEAHVGIFVAGKSGVIHECDVAVLDQREAQVCRAERVHPRASKVLLAIECKFHSATLQLGQGRGFLGLTKDIMPKNRFLASNVTSQSIERLASHHNLEWDTGIDLVDPNPISLFKARLSRAFRNFQAESR
jgi:hypothetical protein